MLVTIHKLHTNYIVAQPSGVSQPVSTQSETIWHENSVNSGLHNTRISNLEYRPIAQGTATPLAAPAQNAGTSITVQTNHIRTLEEIESELLRQRFSQSAYEVSNIPSTASQTAGNRLSPISLLPPSQPQSYQEYEPQNVTVNDVEHQLRMMHLNQVQHLQANRQEQQLLQQQLQMEQLERQQQRQHQFRQRQLQEQQLQEHLRHEQLRRMQLRQLEELQQQEQIRQMQQIQQEQKERLFRQVLQQQQPLYQSTPHSRLVRTPERLGMQNQLQKSFPNTPEPQFSVSHASQQNYVTADHQNQLQMQRQLLLQLSQAGVAPDQIHLLDAAQREAILNEARRKIQAAEELDQRNRRRLAKMERMV